MLPVTGPVRPGPVRPGPVSPGPVRPGQVRSGPVRSGPACLALPPQDRSPMRDRAPGPPKMQKFEKMCIFI